MKPFRVAYALVGIATALVGGFLVAKGIVDSDTGIITIGALFLVAGFSVVGWASGR